MEFTIDKRQLDKLNWFRGKLAGKNQLNIAGNITVHRTGDDSIFIHYYTSGGLSEEGKAVRDKTLRSVYSKLLGE